MFPLGLVLARKKRKTIQSVPFQRIHFVPGIASVPFNSKFFAFPSMEPVSFVSAGAIQFRKSLLSILYFGTGKTMV